MKLNLKNFSGTLSNGNKYRIFYSSKYLKKTDEYFLTLDVKENLSNYFNTWFHNENLSVKGWYKKGDFKECLKECLLKLESKLDVQLLKSEMKIAS